MKLFFIAGYLLILISCSQIKEHTDNRNDSATKTSMHATQYDSSNTIFIQTKNTTPEQLADYAKTLIGIPYKYASTDPREGFDCSGFISYTFNHFNIRVPRSSVEFTNVYHEISLVNAMQGDLILFTGTDITQSIVGHMGIIVSNINDSISFIHSTSGKAYGVTITPLNEYYMSRFVKVVRVFRQNDSL